MIRRVLVEKKDGFDIESSKVKSIIQNELNIKTLRGIRLINCYDVKGLLESEMEHSNRNVFSENNVDNILEERDIKGDWIFRVKSLPGQFDQRADSSKQCIQLLLATVEKVQVEYSKIYLINGELSKSDKERIKKYLINPVELVEVSLEKPENILETAKFNWENPHIDGFRILDNKGISSLKEDYGLAMTTEDIAFIIEHFKIEERDPFLTELMVLDTYWSDHCRHTTFNTKLSNIDLSELSYDSPISKTMEKYISIRNKVYKEKAKTRDITLMDMATISTKYHLKTNDLNNLDISEEINACSINVSANINGKKEDYLVMFKNETHNHPTEIEPFGGASTCLGGAIRDPLSGRAYVYQGMRVTGSANPTEDIALTLEGKLPQFKITREAAKGFSSYGNQIGLSTGQVSEYYDAGFKAKRMEVGAVIAATPKENVIRQVPIKGDVIMLIGGKTGRDGVGGATGSSKSHDENSTLECGAQVQKGNAPEERKIQRLFRNPQAAKMIKRCNDFGAGGVSVAVGELADSIDIFLDKVPKKYDGLNPMEIALSESQERMAIVIDPKKVDTFKKYLLEENLEGTLIANVTDSGRLRMFYDKTLVLDLSRDFIETSGASLEVDVKVSEIDYDKNPMIINKIESRNKYELFDEKVRESCTDLNRVSQKGLVEMFDSSIGCGSVLAPFGGKYQKTPAQGMVAKIPTLKGETDTVTVMTHGYDPSIGLWSTYHGGYYSVVESVSKAVSLGANVDEIVLSLQEYFERLSDDHSWGLPVAGLLGSMDAQLGLKVSAIGGKDSMSGTFKDINVPPTIISFAVAPSDLASIITPELKKAGSNLYMYYVKADSKGISNAENLYKMFKVIDKENTDNKILSANSVGRGGAVHTLLMMAIGNKIGVTIDNSIEIDDLLNEYYGAIIVESDVNLSLKTSKDFEIIKLGTTNESQALMYGEYKYSYDEFINEWEKPLRSVFPTDYEFDNKVSKMVIETIEANKNEFGIYKSKVRVEHPKVVIPVFPGTNCEWDTAAAFEKEGAIVEFVNIRNISQDLFNESILNLEKAINSCNILALPGGFSAGDEPDGSGKFISVILKNEKIRRAITKHLKFDDGLIIGICNGFQALIKTGLLPYGEIRDLDESSPTLTYNSIGRHVSTIVNTKIMSKKSPWLMLDTFDTNYKTPISHGEGRFVASGEILESLIENNQIASVYTDDNGRLAQSSEFNPNGSVAGVEGIISPDGRIFGKMAHSERVDKSLYKNLTNIEKMRIFEAGVKYFRG
ncbi:MAG: phosphoribosylformylglycinamidine synthase [Acidaminobacteraceae bacterium]